MPVDAMKARMMPTPQSNDYHRRPNYAAGIPSDEVLMSCAQSCSTPYCDTIGQATNDLIACLQQSCTPDCLEFQASH